MSFLSRKMRIYFESFALPKHGFLVGATAGNHWVFIICLTAWMLEVSRRLLDDVFSNDKSTYILLFVSRVIHWLKRGREKKSGDRKIHNDEDERKSHSVSQERKQRHQKWSKTNFILYLDRPMNDNGLLIMWTCLFDCSISFISRMT